MLFTNSAKIETTRLTIRLVAHDDLPALLEVNSNDNVTRHLPFDSWKDMSDAEAWYERAMKRHEAGESWQFVIVLRETNRVIGTCLLFRFEETSQIAEIGYVLGQAYWRGGYMREAMTSFIDYAFNEAGVRRLEAEVDPRNAASCKLLERLGFVKEGVQRENWVSKGEISDSNLYGLLRKEWSVATDAVL
jgi:[ribosomal protein S5]-alanine N-acetyltransferase